MAGLSALFSPRTVAIIGASPDMHRFRGRTLKVMLQHPFTGRIFPVSRSHSIIQGVPAYPTILDVPERVDLAVLIIPAEHVPDELERCGRAGVGAALILSSGFAETGGEVGRELERRVRAIAEHHGMTLCGPNSEGFVNMHAGLCATFSPVVEDPAAPLVEPRRTSGPIAVVAQSGGMGFALFDRGRARELPFSHVITTGNEARLEVFDVVDHLLDEGRSDVFLLFVESIKAPRTFHRVAARALAAGKPIIVAKIGQSEAGRRAALAHTGALAGDPMAYRAVFRHHGILSAGDLDEMVDLAAAFSRYGGRLPAGRRVGIGSASGGGGSWLADACVAAGLEIPVLDPITRATIDSFIPPFGTSQNPVDGTAQAILQAGYGELAHAIASSPAVDAVIVVVSARSASGFERERETLARVAAESAKPIVMWSYSVPSPDSVRILGQAGLPLFTSMRGAARAVAAMAEYRAVRERRLRAAGAGRHRGPARALGGGAQLPAGELARLLGDYGISLAGGGQDARAAAATLPALSVRRDATFGPLLLVGAAGPSSAELARAPVPLSHDEAAELVASAALAPAFVDLIVRVAHLVADHADRIAELDVCPVTVDPGGSVAVASARLVLTAATAPG